MSNQARMILSPNLFEHITMVSYLKNNFEYKKANISFPIMCPEYCVLTLKLVYYMAALGKYVIFENVIKSLDRSGKVLKKA